MVLPEYRRQGIGKALVRHLEAWALKQHRDGIWLITHRMADWYHRHFNYRELGKTHLNKVEKTIMIRPLGSCSNREKFIKGRS